MKLRKLAVAASLAAIGLSAALTTPAFAAEEQFFPLLWRQLLLGAGCVFHTFASGEFNQSASRTGKYE